MPVAADEPTYCYCGDVSYGEMIACENEVRLYIWGCFTDASSVLENGSIWTVWGWLLLRRESGIVTTVIHGGVIRSDQGGRERGHEFGTLDILEAWVTM